MKKNLIKQECKNAYDEFSKKFKELFGIDLDDYDCLVKFSPDRLKDHIIIRLYDSLGGFELNDDGEFWVKDIDDCSLQKFLDDVDGLYEFRDWIKEWNDGKEIGIIERVNKLMTCKGYDIPDVEVDDIDVDGDGVAFAIPTDIMGEYDIVLATPSNGNEWTADDFVSHLKLAGWDGDTRTVEYGNCMAVIYDATNEVCSVIGKNAWEHIKAAY